MESSDESPKKPPAKKEQEEKKPPAKKEEKVKEAACQKQTQKNREFHFCTVLHRIMS